MLGRGPSSLLLYNVSGLTLTVENLLSKVFPSDKRVQGFSAIGFAVKRTNDGQQ